MNTYEDDEFARIEMESKVRQVMQQAVWDSATRVPEGDIRALQALHDENERLGLYDEAYGIPFVEKDQLEKLLNTNEIQQTPSNS